MMVDILLGIPWCQKVSTKYLVSRSPLSRSPITVLTSLVNCQASPSTFISYKRNEVNKWEDYQEIFLGKPVGLEFYEENTLLKFHILINKEK